MLTVLGLIDKPRLMKTFVAFRDFRTQSMIQIDYLVSKVDAIFVPDALTRDMMYS